jgi:hypothetical protein
MGALIDVEYIKNMNNEPVMNTPKHNIQLTSDNVPTATNPFERIFSIAANSMKWFIGLRWYVIFFIVVLGSYLLFQVEYAIEKRRVSREKKRGDADKDIDADDEKEGMEGTPASLIGSRESSEIKFLPLDHGFPSKKRVSFYDENSSTKMANPITQIYNWWILPWMYVLFRNIGIQHNSK